MASALRTHTSRLKSQKGFSLFEILIALVILAGVFTVVGMAWSTSQLRLRKMKLNNQVAYLLDYKVADIERQYRDQITLLPEDDAGDFEDMGKDYKAFSWKLKSKKFELPDLTPLLIKDQGKADPMVTMLLGQMKDFFAQAAKEVTITVVYTYKKQKVEYSATTFLIDFNQQLPIPDLSGLGGGQDGGGTSGGTTGGGTTGGGGGGDD
jgi:general secretion pathway protein I